MATVSPDALAELCGKYREMLAMRLDDGLQDERLVRERMAKLASRFPGALREVDELDLDVIRDRIARLERALDGSGEVEPWMTAIALFHALTRGALSAKRWLAGRKAVEPAITAQFVLEAAEPGAGSGALEWALELERVASPPRGRLTDLVFARIARTLALPEDEARRLVFGAARR